MISNVVIEDYIMKQINYKQVFILILVIFSCLISITCSSDIADTGSNPELTGLTDQNYLKNKTIEDIKFTNTGAAATSCEAMPELPAGLQLNPSEGTCIISGTPLVEIEKQLYTIKAMNSSGESSVATNIAVTIHKGYIWKRIDTDPMTNGIQNAPWSGRTSHQVISHNDKLFVMGGYDDNALDNTLNDIWMSKDEGITWEQVDTDPTTDGVQNAPWSGRSGFGSVVHNDKIFVLGGKDGRGTNTLNDIWMSIDEGITWEQIDTDPTTDGIQNAPWQARSHFGIVVHNDKIFVLGGENSTNNYLNDIWMSTDEGITWEQIDTDPTTDGVQNAPWQGRTAFGLVSHKGSLFVIGGFNRPSDTRYNDVWKSSDGTDWSEITFPITYWSIRSGHSVFTHEGRIFILGGRSYFDNNTNGIWISHDGIIWNYIEAVGARWSPRVGQRSLSHNNKLFVMGGFGTDIDSGSSGRLNDIWITIE